MIQAEHYGVMKNDNTCCFLTCILVRRLQSKGILVQIFPLHEQEELKRLSFSWYKRVKLSLQPLGKLTLIEDKLTESAFLQDE